MKWMVLLLVVLAGVWLIKRQQLRQSQAARPARRRLMPPKPMVACRHCGMHVPADEAVAGQAGMHYCSAAHRQAHERQDAGT